MEVGPYAKTVRLGTAEVGNRVDSPIKCVKSGATRQDRTGDLLITNQPLYQLS